MSTFNRGAFGAIWFAVALLSSVELQRVSAAEKLTCVVATYHSYPPCCCKDHSRNEDGKDEKVPIEPLKDGKELTDDGLTADDFIEGFKYCAVYTADPELKPKIDEETVQCKTDTKCDYLGKFANMAQADAPKSFDDVKGMKDNISLWHTDDTGSNWKRQVVNEVTVKLGDETTELTVNDSCGGEPDCLAYVAGANVEWLCMFEFNQFEAHKDTLGADFKDGETTIEFEIVGGSAPDPTPAGSGRAALAWAVAAASFAASVW